MDYEARLTKVEMLVDTIRDALDRLQAAIVQTQQDIADLRQHSDQRFAELRQHTDQGLAELRQHTDQGLAELRQHTDQGLAESRQHTDQGLAELRQYTERGFDAMRKEHGTYVRWIMAALLANTAMLAGMFAKVAGLY